ncbi:MAG: pyruvate carboxylase, partial [Pseudomonadota bacterium]|nr:pyruvate carboxylase [Pseudomonadota bacterium]
ETAKTVFDRDGAAGLVKWIGAQDRLLVTDTTFRDAHQSLLATRMRTADLVAPMAAYENGLRGLFSLEVWGGATFDVAYRFLKEDPWQRLEQMRAAAPSHLFQMLLRGSNAVGYTNYPDNVVKDFVVKAFDNGRGVDVFRVFDSLNWVDNMRVAIDAVIDARAICEATICYSGDLLSPDEDKYTLAYYVDMARQFEAAGAHTLAIKDMAGVARPAAAAKLVETLKGEVGLPIHFHTHDTSGGQVATVLAASAAGVDIIDAAMDPLSGLTSQPNLGTIAEALRGLERDPELPRDTLDKIAHYWDGARRHYAAFEADMRAGSSDVFEHAMPGGQYTNLRQQARSLGIEHRWPEVVKRY